jgi:WD40 repeat protein
VLSVALHPSGLHVLLGFSDKLRMMNVLIDDIRQYHELPVRACRECRFSHGGHLFAAASGCAVSPLLRGLIGLGNTATVFHTYTFEAIGVLKGHNGKIRSIAWSPDDSKIVTCAIDGWCLFVF